MTVTNATMVVAIDYATNHAADGLSHSSIVMIEAACKFLNERRDGVYALAYCNPDFPDKGVYPSETAAWKQELRLRSLKRDVPLFIATGSNSINEALGIRDAALAQSFKPDNIIIFCDRWHVMRLGMIWKHFFPESAITFNVVAYVRGSDHRQLLARRQSTWILANFAGFMAMKVFGIEAISSIRQP